VTERSDPDRDPDRDAGREPNAPGTSGVSGVSGAPGDRDGTPFGLPVLEELPELAMVLRVARDIDALHVRLVDQLIELRLSGLVEAATGVAIERWLATIGRFTRSDRRMLTTTGEVLVRLPLLRSAYTNRRLSWSQLRTVVLRVHKLPKVLDPQLDTALADAIGSTEDGDPDALLQAVSWVVASHEPERVTEPDGPWRPWVHLQPRLDGTGGKVTADLDAVGFAAFDTATAPSRADLEGVGSGRTLIGQDPAAPGDPRTGRGRTSEVRAARLTHLCLTEPAAADAPLDVVTPAAGGTRVPRRLRTVVRVELDTLLGGQLPTQLLTTLAGAGCTWTGRPLGA
jgi:hypothetical protein